MQERVNLGLSSQEAHKRLQQYGANCLPENKPATFYALIWKVVSEPMFLMLLGAGIIYLLLGDLSEALFLLFFVFVIIGITLVQEHKTQRALESLRDLSAPRALVLRDGEEIRIPSFEVVPGDVMVLHEGDRIAADGYLLKGQISVDESLLSGESVSVDKSAGNALPDSIYASTMVTKGIALAQVVTTGCATQVGGIGESLRTGKEISSGLQHASRSLVRVLTILAFLMALLLILINWIWNQHTFLESVLTGIALSMALLPEEIPVVLTVFLALGAWRISKINVLTRKITAVEALGAINVLAVDKTGTLTQNRMQITELAVGEKYFQAALASELPETFHKLIEFAMLATPIDPFDPMEKEIHSFGRTYLVGTEHIHDESPQFLYELSGDILAMTQVYSDKRPFTYMLATKGSPEAVADLCHLPESEYTSIKRKVEVMAKRGLRVLGVACGEWKAPVKNADWPISQHDFDFTFLGLIGFRDPPREDAADAIAQCHSAGIRVIMITGDHPATARSIAKEVGLDDNTEIVLGDEIAALSDKELTDRLEKVTICARMKPEQKLRLVNMMQSSGNVVAMTGDGVNDAPALQAADVGIAMGARGTDVARESAALVLVDDSFASIVSAIRQGRRIYDNITKATRFIFAVHIPIIALALLPAIFQWPDILMPVHIVFLQLLIDPACAVVFEAESSSVKIMNRPPKPLNANPFSLKNVGMALLQGGGIAVLLLAGYALLKHNGYETNELRMTIFSALVVMVFFLVVANSERTVEARNNIWGKNRWMVFMLGGVSSILIAVAAIPAIRDMMKLAQLTWNISTVTAILVLLGVVWLYGLRRLSSIK